MSEATIGNQRYQIVAEQTLEQMNHQVNKATFESWEPIGSPFRDERKNLWCQAMTRDAPMEPGKVKLREPKR